MVVLETGFALFIIGIVLMLVMPPVIKLLRKYVAWMMKDD